MSSRRAAVSILALVTLAGCVANEPAADAGSGTIAVESSATACTVAPTEVPSGTVSFAVQNTGDQVTEFYLLAEDGLEVVAEVENIGPGLTRELVVSVSPGTYVAACKPGMVGDGIRTTIRVTD